MHKNYPLTGLDLIVFTLTELEDAMLEVVKIGKEAVHRGKLIYERV